MSGVLDAPADSSAAGPNGAMSSASARSIARPSSRRTRSSRACCASASPSASTRPGDRLPSEAELCEAYGVSPMTVRRAVTQLVREEVAATEQGRGTFVKSPRAGRRDLRPRRPAAATSRTPAPRRRITRGAHRLAVSPGVRQARRDARRSRVIAIKRLLSRDGEAVFYHSEYLVFDPARPAGRGRARGHRRCRTSSRASAARASSTAA